MVKLKGYSVNNGWKVKQVLKEQRRKKRKVFKIKLKEVKHDNKQRNSR